MQRIFSGIQPTGNLHLGNYLGAIKNWVQLQDKISCIFCIVDLHAITVWQSPEDLRSNTLEVTAALIASGINPENQIIFQQSQVSAHAELAWILNCISRVGWLNRMTQFKEKAGKNRENASVGLYTYPNLMAADILAYKATHVPVGEDQKQHLELVRDIAQKFNNDYDCNFFPIIEPIIMGEATRVMSLRDGKIKMSKSDPSENARINLVDDQDVISRKIRKAKTDPESLPVSESKFEGRPEAANLMSIYAGLSGRKIKEVIDEFGGSQFSVFKKSLIDLAITELSPIQREFTRLMDDKAYLRSVLRNGADSAKLISTPVMNDLYNILGFSQ